MAVKQLPDGRWICYWNEAGKRKKEYFGRGIDAEANARRRNDALNLRRGRPHIRQVGPTFFDLAKEYYSRKGFDRKPHESLSYRLDGAILPIIGHIRAMHLTGNHLEDYVVQRRLDKIKDNSIAREITDIKAILTWATRRTPPLIPINTVRDFKGPAATDTIIMPPEPEELAAIYAAAAAHLQRFILLASYLGARPGATELLSLAWSSVSWSGRSVRIISADKGGPPSRYVPLHQNLIGPMEEWQQADRARYGRLADTMRIVHYWGQPITTIKRAWREALKRAGITRRIRPYDLRHRFVTTALEQGADIGALADIVGSRPETLRKHYQHVTREMHRQTIARMPALPVGPSKELDPNCVPKT